MIHKLFSMSLLSLMLLSHSHQVIAQTNNQTKPTLSNQNRAELNTNTQDIIINDKIIPAAYVDYYLKDFGNWITREEAQKILIELTIKALEIERLGLDQTLDFRASNYISERQNVRLALYEQYNETLKNQYKQTLAKEIKQEIDNLLPQSKAYFLEIIYFQNKHELEKALTQLNHQKINFDNLYQKIHQQKPDDIKIKASAVKTYTSNLTQDDTDMKNLLNRLKIGEHTTSPEKIHGAWALVRLQASRPLSIRQVEESVHSRLIDPPARQALSAQIEQIHHETLIEATSKEQPLIDHWLSTQGKQFGNISSNKKYVNALEKEYQFAKKQGLLDTPKMQYVLWLHNLLNKSTIFETTMVQKFNQTFNPKRLQKEYQASYATWIKAEPKMYQISYVSINDKTLAYELMHKLKNGQEFDRTTFEETPTSIAYEGDLNELEITNEKHLNLKRLNLIKQFKIGELGILSETNNSWTILRLDNIRQLSTRELPSVRYFKGIKFDQYQQNHIQGLIKKAKIEFTTSNKP